MNIYSWNVNGIRAVVKKGEWTKFVESADADIICLQETKSTPEQAMLDTPGYVQFWNSSQTKKGYSGTAVFTKIEPLLSVNDIPDEFVKSSGLAADDYGSANHEGRVIALAYEDFWLVTAYTPNAKDDLSRLDLRQKWDAALAAYCASLQAAGKPVIYCGDMNVAHTELDLANPKPNVGKKGFTAEERTGFNNWLKAGFVDTFRESHEGNGYYTWWSHFAQARARNVGWRIDYFLVSNSLKSKISKAEIHPLQMGSDHCPVSVTLDI